MGAFIVAGIALAIGVVGFMLWVAIASQMTAPSVQDSGWGIPWLGFWVVIAVLIALTHWVHVGW